MKCVNGFESVSVLRVQEMCETNDKSVNTFARENVCWAKKVMMKIE